MTLGQLQEEFGYCLGQLLVWAHDHGFHARCGEVYRPPETAAIYASDGRGVTHSLHCNKLAADLNLIVRGRLSNKRDDYRPLADFWKSLHPLARWGGDWTSRNDPYHFSFTYGGRE